MDVFKHLSIPGFLFLLLSAPALADAPAFDRPGIAFAPSTLPAGEFDWEQGLPDWVRDSGEGVRSTSYSLDTTLCIGVTPTLEVQIAGSAWNRLDLRTNGTTTHADGAADIRLAFKWAPTLSDKDMSLALLGGVTLDTGAAAFSNGRPIYSLGATLGRNLGSGCAVAMYANVDRNGGAATWTLSPNLSFPIAGSLSGYVEAGRMFGGGVSASLAGAGVTWLLHDRVQLDLYGLRGLTARSPDLQAGFGVSAFWR